MPNHRILREKDVPCFGVHLLLVSGFEFLMRPIWWVTFCYRPPFRGNLCRSPSSLLTGNHSSLRALCHPFWALAPGGGRGGLGGEDGHSVLHWRQYSRKSRTFPYVQEVGNLSQKALISTLLDKATAIWYTKVVNRQPAHWMEVTDAHETDVRRTTQGPAD